MLRKLFICAAVLLATTGVYAKESGTGKNTDNSRVKIKYNYRYDDIVNYLYSFNNPKLILIAHCESFDFKTNKYNIRAVGDGGKAYGLLQFHYSTFMEFAERVRMHHPHWKNPYQQIYIANWMIRHGYIRRWSCYGILKHYHRL
ncbi:hypothetical protein M1513_00175 [Patescibacteria group bacterium]|nr:hypothetical protein [Patescibacteria group bacterium]MCL5733562.1 hypothetical protein [Patescibacteria group bacterium]